VPVGLHEVVGVTEGVKEGGEGVTLGLMLTVPV